MQTLDEMENELRDKRALSGWYGMRRDYAMQNQLAHECYKLSVDIEYLTRPAR